MRLLLAAALAVAPLGASAATLDGPHLEGIDRFYVFGDSLSDPGNVVAANPLLSGLLAFAGLSPEDGSITNGLPWAAQLGATLSSGQNYAQAGARAAGDSSFEVAGVSVDPLDLPEQIAAFDADITDPSQVGPNALAAFLIGGNDMRAAAGDTPAELAQRITDVVSNISDGIATVVANGVPRVVLMGLPDLGLTPEAISGGFADTARKVTLAFNAALVAAAQANPVVDYYDSFALFEDIAASHSTFGITEPLGEPCIEALNDLGDLTRDCAGFAFWDTIHPTEATHAFLAEDFAAFVNGPAVVPLPAGLSLMVTGLGAFALLRRRQRAA